MPTWYSIIYTSFIAVSIILFIVSFFTTGSSKFGSSIAGYSTLSAGILLILGFLLSNISKIAASTNMTMFQYFLLIFKNVGAFLIILGIIGYSLYLLITYQSRILSGQIPSSYTTFSQISIILILIQIYLFYHGMNSASFKTSGKISGITSSIITLISVFNIISILILGSILKYFVTDG